MSLMPQKGIQNSSRNMHHYSDTLQDAQFILKWTRFWGLGLSWRTAAPFDRRSER